MKIRANYVSNSSSSSYLVLCRNFEEFNKFKVFEMYERFKEDFDNSKKEDVISWLRTELYSYFYYLHQVNKHESGHLNDLWQDALRSNNAMELVYLDNALAETQKIIHEHRKNMYDLIKSSTSEEVEEYYEESINYEAIAKTLYKELRNLGYTIASFEYCDHDDDESYMEHAFMPFLARNPEVQYQQVFTRNEH